MGNEKDQRNLKMSSWAVSRIERFREKTWGKPRPGAGRPVSLAQALDKLIERFEALDANKA